MLVVSNVSKDMIKAIEENLIPAKINLLNSSGNWLHISIPFNKTIVLEWFQHQNKLTTEFGISRTALSLGLLNNIHFAFSK